MLAVPPEQVQPGTVLLVGDVPVAALHISRNLISVEGNHLGAQLAPVLHQLHQLQLALLLLVVCDQHIVLVPGVVEQAGEEKNCQSEHVFFLFYVRQGKLRIYTLYNPPEVLSKLALGR